MKSSRLNVLSNDIGAWARQFKSHNPALGILEETGEAAHCILKREQGIRGFDKPDHFKKKFGDGLADIAIYALHYSYLNAISFDEDVVPEIPSSMTPEGAVNEMFGNIASATAVLLMGIEHHGIGLAHISLILRSLAWLAHNEEMRLDNLVNFTWNEVSRRDWTTNPQNADKVATGDVCHGSEVVK